MQKNHDEIRVRIAPGPTGAFHIGRSRTALLNWLFARNMGGKFILRIEDTDQNRSEARHIQGILDSLRWLGLDWDEGPDIGGPYGPYFQMARLEIYAAFAERLSRADRTYPCYCTPEELSTLREQAQREHRPFRYPRTCRNLTPDERHARESEGRKAVTRLAMPVDGQTGYDDLLLGTVTVDNDELDDFVIVRTDGIPTYNFAVVVDDVSMKITHVIRGQEHIPNTPRQVLIYRYLDEPLPIFGHLPMVLGADRSKLSARHGAEPVTAYGQDGYLPESIFNYLATLGASYDGEKEIFSRDELIRVFDLKKLGKSGAIFSDEKLEWLNGVYIRSLPVEEFVRRSLPFLEMRGLVPTPPTPEDIVYATDALRLEQERVKTLAETPGAVEFFFENELVYDPVLLVVKKSTDEDARLVLQSGKKAAEAVENWVHDELEAAFRRLADELSLKTGVVFGTLRVAITGRTAAPPLFDTMQALGRRRVLDRIDRALSALAAPLSGSESA